MNINFWEAIKRERPATHATPSSNLVHFGPISVEPKADYDRNEKRLYTFDQAQALVAGKGLVLPAFRDVMTHVIVPGLEGKLKGAQKEVFDDMFKSYGEWTDNAFYLDGDTFYVSAGITGLVWDQKASAYNATAMTVSELPKAYDRKGLVNGWNTLKDVAVAAPNLVNDLYGSEYNALPSRIKKNAGIYLPADKTVRPVGRGDDVVIYLDAGGDYGYRAVRGAQKNIPSETKVKS